MPNQQARSKTTRRAGTFITISACILLLLTLLVWSAPLILEWQGEAWLEQNGATNPDIGDIDFNPFTGELSIIELQAGQTENARFTVGRLKLKINYLPLFDRQIAVEQIVLSHADLDLHIDDSNKVSIGKLKIPTGEPETEQATTAVAAPKAPWDFGLGQLVVESINLRAHLPQHQGNIQIQQLNISRVATWKQQQHSPIELNMLIDGARVRLTSRVAPFKTEPELSGELLIENVDLTNYSQLLTIVGISEPAGVLTSNIKLDGTWRADKSFAIKFDGNFQAREFHIQLPDLELQQQQLAWQGNGNIHFPPTETESLVTTTSSLTLADTRVRLSQQNLDLSQDNLSWNGSVQYNQDQTEAGDGLQVAGELALKGITLKDTQSEQLLADIQSTTLKQLAIEGLNQIHIAQLKLDQIIALADVDKAEAPQQLLAAGSLQADSISLLQKQHLQITTVDIQALQLALLRDDKGQLKWLKPAVDVPDSGDPKSKDVDTTAVATTEETAAGDQEKPQPFTIKVDKLVIAENSGILFEDATVKPAYQARLQPFQLTLEKLDNTRPDQPASLTLETQLEKYTTFTLAGTLTPFQEQPSANLKGKLSGLDLPSLSPYAVTYMGYDLRRGRLDSDSRINIDKGMLNINNRLLISKLHIVEANAETASAFSQQLAMPLDAAIGMLRDGEGNMAFDLPITGNLTEPEFSLSGVINLALGTAIKAAAMNYVTNALQPLGTIILVGKLVNKATQIRFQPLEFTPGSNELSGKGVEYATKIADLLQKRPELKLTLCGVANPEDQKLVEQHLLETRAAASKSKDTKDKPLDQILIKTELLTLAETRGNNLKDFFVATKKINAERLFSCRPSIDLEQESKPRIEITL